eukprot:11115685-Alexandrium_andersonii.AAC.1
MRAHAFFQSLVADLRKLHRQGQQTALCQALCKLCPCTLLQHGLNSADKVLCPIAVGPLRIDKSFANEVFH